ncbi:MAG: autotransporter outer membrane beta-barrel domain-containing protein [Phascolarctobacterium sp.]
MFKSHRYLTVAVLLSCSCLLAPFYAHAEEPIRVIEGNNKEIIVTMPIAEENASGTGLLVKGSENNITIDTDITASGTAGTGLLVESGYKNNITLNAGKTIQALGDDGIAVSFIGNKEIVAMSDGATEPVPCVDKFIVNGSLVGKKAAIYIDPSTYVRDIYIQNGATLQGDIIASEKNSGGEVIPRPGITTLTFGNSNIETVDNDLKISYNGNIQGDNRVFLKVIGTNLEYNGTAKVSSVQIERGATISGSGTYILNSYETDGIKYWDAFTNNGTLDLCDGKATTVVNITGNYTQNGKLLIEFNSDADSDHLQVREGDAVIQGFITLTPQVDYYFNGQTIVLDPIVSVESSGTLTVYSGKPEINNISPVLKFTVADEGTTGTKNGKEYVCDYENTQYIINVERVDNGYQSVADDKISAGIGSAIDNDTEKQKEDPLYIISDAKKELLKALDNPYVPTNITGDDRDKYAKKVINANLKKLNPNVVSSQAQAVVDTHATLNNLVSVASLVNVGSLSTNIPAPRLGGGLGPAAQPTPKYNSWRNIVMPFSGYTDQHNGSNGYTNHNSGVIGAIERTFANGLTHGYHAALNHQSTSDSGSTVKGEGLYLGAQASYAPADWNGWSVFGSARLGVEQMRSHRNVAILGTGGLYTGRVDSDWTGFSGSLNLGTALTKEHGVLISGPFAALDYSFVHRPGVTETGAAYRAHLDGATYDSLRTQLGYRLVTKPKPLDSYDSTQWQAHASVAWNHELLNDNGTTTYQLVEFPGTTIEDDVETYGRDSMSIAAGVIFKTPNRLDVGLTLGSDIYRKGGSSIYGKVNFEWKF